MDDIRKQIISTYDSEILQPALGNGSVRKMLLEGLEQVLNTSKPLPENIISPWLAKIDEEIDEEKLRHYQETRGYSKASVGKIIGICTGHGLKTNRDLITVVRDCKTYKDVKKRFTQFSSVGDQTAQLATTYLAEMGYPPEENSDVETSLRPEPNPDTNKYILRLSQ